MDRLPVGFEIAQAVGGGQRAFAQHVEGIAIVGVVALAAARQGFVDGAAHHELVAHDPHRLAHREPDHRLADAADQAFEGVVDVALGVVGQVDQLAGQHQAPGRGVDQHRVGLAHMPFPVGIAQLVADQFVGGVLVRDAQQGFGHAHQQHAFLAAEVVLAHEGFDGALVLRAGTDPADQVGGGGLDGGAVGVRLAGGGQQFANVFGFVAHPGRGDRGAQGVGRGRQFRREDPARGLVDRQVDDLVHGSPTSGETADSTSARQPGRPRAYGGTSSLP